MASIQVTGNTNRRPRCKTTGTSLIACRNAKWNTNYLEDKFAGSCKTKHSLLTLSSNRAPRYLPN